MARFRRRNSSRFGSGKNARYADRVKVIVMEDAERLLWRRDGDNREAVSSLLNVADGLMGRMLRLHIICSVNARMEDLDSAILRPGRLMNHRRCKLLPRTIAEQIALKKKIAFRARLDVAEYSLADVLNPGAKPRPNEKRGIGFRTPITV
jgi:ATPase family associated with various cellular activities (AAA)